IASGRAEMNPAANLSKALKPVRSKRMATITTPAKIGALLRSIDAYEGSYITRCALLLAPLTFVRPGILRAAEWVEVDLDAAEWHIPAKRMKMKRPHIVPLSRQAYDVLLALHPLTGNGRYLFPSVRSRERCMSNNTVNAALRRMGYTKEEITGHGFRHMASTLLNEANWNKDAIERQLAHKDPTMRGVYNAAEYLPERTQMMQWWADYLDDLRHQA